MRVVSRESPSCVNLYFPLMGHSTAYGLADKYVLYLRHNKVMLLTPLARLGTFYVRLCYSHLDAQEIKFVFTIFARIS